MTAARHSAETLVNLDRYPLHDPNARAQIVADGRRGMAEVGSAVLPGFLRPEAVQTMAAEAAALVPVSHRRDRMLTA